MSAEIDNAKSSGDNPREWARQFINLYSWLGAEVIQEHILIHWFSAAIETGKKAREPSNEDTSVRAKDL